MYRIIIQYILFNIKSEKNLFCLGVLFFLSVKKKKAFAFFFYCFIRSNLLAL